MTHELFRPHHRVHAPQAQEAKDSRGTDIQDSLAELVHELRQPLSTIEALTYYLELICSDREMCPHLERIQAMVIQANKILERVSEDCR